MGYDEMNVAPSAGNYGWPFFIGYSRAYPTTENGPPRAYGPPQDPEHPVNRSPNNTGLRDLPPARARQMALTRQTRQTRQTTVRPPAARVAGPVRSSAGPCA